MADPKLQVEITAETRGLQAGIAAAQAQMKGFAAGMNDVSKGIAGSFASIKAPFLALAGLVGGAAFLKSTVTETVNWTVEANKLAKTLGITSQEASVLNLAIGDIYGTMDEFLPLVGKITKTLNTNEDAFHRLGVKTRDNNGNLRSTPAIIAEVNTKLAEMKSGTDRNISSTQIYGKGWMDVQRYLGLTAEVMQAAQEKAEKLNLLVGPDGADKVATYRASVNDLEDTVKALKIGIGNELLPVLKALNNDLSDNGPEAVGILGKSFVYFYSGIYEFRRQVELTMERVGYLFNIMVLQFSNLGKQMKAALKLDFDEATRLHSEYNDKKKVLDEKSNMDVASIELKYGKKQYDLFNPEYKTAKPDAPGKRGDTSDHQAKLKENQFAEELAKLSESRLKHRLQETLNQKELLELEQAEVELAKQLDTYEKQRRAGGSDQEFLTLSTQAKENAERAKLDIETKYNGLRLAEAEKIWKIREESDQKENEILAKMEDAKLQHDFDMGRISADKLLQLQVEMEEARFQVALKALKERKGLTDEEQAHIDSEIQQLKLKHREANQSFSFQQEGASSRTNFGEGMSAYIRKSRQELKEWGTFAQGIAKGVESSFANGIKGILSGNMSFAEGLKAIWQGIAETIINSLAEIAAKWIVTNMMKDASDKQSVVSSTTVAAASTNAAVAKTFEAHASFPWVGPLIAAAFVAMMIATINQNKATARATGGLVTRPELTLLGEAGPELVAPEKNFIDWTRNLSANIRAHEERVTDYRLQAAGYSRLASAQGSRNAADGRPYSGGLNVDNRGAMFIGATERQFSDMVVRSMRRHEGKFS